MTTREQLRIRILLVIATCWLLQGKRAEPHTSESILATGPRGKPDEHPVLHPGLLHLQPAHAGPVRALLLGKALNDVAMYKIGAVS